MDAGSDSRPVGKNRARLRWHNVRMPDEHTLTLRQAHQARTDFALIEDQLEFIMGQLARAPTRAYLCRTLLLATARLGLARSGLAADAVVPRLSGVVVSRCWKPGCVKGFTFEKFSGMLLDENGLIRARSGNLRPKAGVVAALVLADERHAVA